MSDRSVRSNATNKTKALEDDKYLKVFKHLESVNLRNKAAFDELLRYTYSNAQDTSDFNSQNNKP